MGNHISDRAGVSPSRDAELPDRFCTWCKVPMAKRLVAGGQFIHYTCPTCIFQHSMKWGPGAG